MSNNNTGQHNILVNINANASGLSSTVAQAGAGLTALGSNTGTQSLRNQLRTATQEAQRLLLANQENTQEYRDQTAQIARLRDAQDIFNRSIPDAGNALAGVSRAAQIVSGSVSALSGVFKSAFPESTAIVDALVQSLGGVSAAIGVIDTIGDVEDVLTPYIDGLRAAAVASNTLTTASSAGAVATSTSTIALLANAAATKIASAATATWNFILNLNPIILIVSALVLVTAGIFTFKDAIISMIPGLKNMFNLVHNVVEAFTDFVGITSEASRASEAFSLAVKKTNADLEYQNKLLAAKSGNERLQYENSRKILDNTISDLKLKAKADEEYNQAYYDGLNKAIQDRNLLDIKEQKRLDDVTSKRAADAKKLSDEEAKKAKAKQDELNKISSAETAELKKRLTVADKIRKDSFLSERTLSEQAISAKYDNDIKVTKAKYGELSKETTTLVEAKNLELSAINEKYVKILEDNTQSIKNANLDEYEKRIIEIEERYDTLVKNDPSNAGALRTQQTEEYKVVRSEQTTNKTITNIDEGLDDPTLSLADKEALQLLKTQESYDAGLISLKTYQNKKTQIEQEGARARIDLDNAEADTKKSNLGAVSDMLSNAASLAGEQSVAGKALAISSASISTYLSAQKAYESLIGIPVVGPTLAPVAAGVAIAGGLLSIKKIASVKVAGSSGGTGGVSLPSFNANSAPVINSTQLSDRGVQDVRVTGTSSEAKQEPIKAYIVSSELDTQAAKDKFVDALSRV